MFDTVEITEAAGGGALMSAEPQGRRYKVRLIEGDRLGSSGYYPADTLRRDGPKVFKRGTPMYLDHQTPDEKLHKPFGSVTTFAAELATDAVYENDGLYAEVEVFEHQMPLIKSLKDKIGISIRAKGLTEMQSINGKQVPVFRELLEARSADFVVRAGAGGKIVSILESAQEEENDEMTITEEGIATAVAAALKDALEAAKPEPAIEPVATVDYALVTELAESLAESNLDAAGRKRVLALHKADGGDIKNLIAAEEAYVASLKPAEEEADAVEDEAEESAGRVESVEGEEAEESATAERTLPSRWTKGK